MFASLRRTAPLLLGLAVGLGLSAGPAAAIPARIGQGVLSALPSAGRLADGRVTAAPAVFSTFCDHWSDQCAATGPDEAMPLDEARWAELERVNAAVNAAITARPDVPGHDEWTLGASEGDCDDYAVEKRRRLADLGWPSATLSLTAAVIPSGEAHLVLTVRTDRGDFVLDNLRPRVTAADRVGYRWLSRQSSLHPRLWVRVHGTAPLPAAVARARTPEPRDAVAETPAVAPSFFQNFFLRTSSLD